MTRPWPNPEADEALREFGEEFTAQVEGLRQAGNALVAGAKRVPSCSSGCVHKDRPSCPGCSGAWENFTPLPTYSGKPITMDSRGRVSWDGRVVVIGHEVEEYQCFECDHLCGKEDVDWRGETWRCPACETWQGTPPITRTDRTPDYDAIKSALESDGYEVSVNEWGRMVAKGREPR